MNFLKISSVSCIFKTPKRPTELKISRNMTVPAGTPGSGAGKGGGGGGSVRDAGGGLGKYAAAQEEGYFHGKQREILEKIKKRIELEKELSQKKKD